ncbi:hypothetical protein C3B55_00142 [Candidatus Pseudomonas adelgestsugas]|uniref:Uncharacterized protein n=1 Tax=Candidatus Pseudomonas adelgestsugas TaxID=1302376 RepID=A0ABX5R8K1_9PSED|nr:hypothetical protein C3B55_00142 [Candidatus Pseudomonas adelgestsugas]
MSYDYVFIAEVYPLAASMAMLILLATTNYNVVFVGLGY